MVLGSLQVTYGTAHFSKSVIGLSSVLIFAFFLTEIVGLSPETMGIVLASSLCFSALCDVSFGWLLRRRIVSAEGAAPIMLAGSILTAISFTSFAAAGLVPENLRLPYVIITLLLYRLSYTLFDLPHNSIMAFVTTTEGSRGTLSAIRYGTAGIAKILVAVFFATWLAEGIGISRALIAFLGCVILSVIGIAGALALYRKVKMSRPNSRSELELLLLTPSKLIDQSNLFPLVLASIALYSSLMATFTKLQVYLVAFTLGAGAAGSSFIVAVALGQIGSQFLWARLAQSMPLIRLYQLTALCLGLVALLFLISAEHGGWFLLLVAGLYGGVSSGLLMAIWSLQAGAANQIKGQTSQRFGLFIFVSKLAQASSVLLLGYLLDQFDFRKAANSDQLIAIMSAGPLCTACFCSLIGLVLTGGKPNLSNQKSSCEEKVQV